MILFVARYNRKRRVEEDPSFYTVNFAESADASEADLLKTALAAIRHATGTVSGVQVEKIRPVTKECPEYAQDLENALAARSAFQELRPAKKPSQRRMQELEERLEALGWVHDGVQPTIVRRKSSLAFAGSLVQAGGRHRWRKENRRCTVGPKTVSFFELGPLGPFRFKNFSLATRLREAIAEAKRGPS